MSSTVKVWDLFVRVFHWGLVVSFAVAWLSADEWDDLHIWAGYAAAALIALRCVWGLIGSHYARFTQFVRSSHAVRGYLSDMLSGREPRYLGHNPAGGIMIILMIVMLAAVSVSGWMYTTQMFSHQEWVEDVHEVLANVLLVLVVLHVAGVFLSSLRHRENLVRSMITGRKRAPDTDDIV